MRVIMRSSIRGRLRPSSCRAPCVDALLLPPTRLSVAGAYAIAATAVRISDLHLLLQRDEFCTGQNARRRPAALLRPTPRCAGSLEAGAAESPLLERGCGRPTG